MSNLVSVGTGNWLTAGTWGLVDTTSYLNSETASATPPTSSGTTARSAGFTTGVITIAGIAVKFRNRTGTTGTLTVRLYNNSLGAAVAATSVTINMADLPAALTASLDGGWIVFQFADVLLLAATSYMVECFTSSATQIILSSGSGNDWARMLIKSSASAVAPVAGDDVVVAGNFTGAGTSNTFTVTMDETAATDYGSNTNSLVTPALAVCNKGVLSFKSTSAANPYLKLSGNAIVYNQGTLNIGTVGTPIPRDSVAILELDPAADGDMGLLGRNGSTVTIQGLSRTSGKNVVSCKLNTDEAIASTSLGVDADTGWLDNDQIAVASTTRTSADSEIGALNGAAGATTLTVDGFAGAGGGLAVAHSGTSPTQAEVICLTRNVRIRSVTSTLMIYVFADNTSAFDIDWAEFYYLGANTTNKRGIEIGTTTGSFAMSFSSVHDCESNGVFMTGIALNNVTLQSNVYWNLASISGSAVSISNGTTGVNIVQDGNIVLKATAGYGFNLNDVGGTFTNNTAVSTVFGVKITEEPGIFGVCSGNIYHSNRYGGSNIIKIGGGTISSCTAWRNSGISLGGGVIIGALVADLTLDSLVAFGNFASNVNIVSGAGVTLSSPVLNGDTAFSTTNGINVGYDSGTLNMTITNGDLSTVSGIKTAHTNDLAVGGNFAVTDARVILKNTKLGAATEVLRPSALGNFGFVSSERHDQTAGNHKTWMRYGATTGALVTDSVIFHTASPSQRCVPNSAAFKLESATQFRGIKAAVANGSSVTIGVWVRKSIASDAGGVLYAGNQPRLVMKSNSALGLNSDVVIATMTVANNSGTWELLTGTTSTVNDDGALEFVVDCDGTGGAWINVDDWSAS